MKKIIFIIASVIILLMNSNSESRTISNFATINPAFYPSTVNVEIGDTINWISSISEMHHSTICDGSTNTVPPAGASSWNSELGFRYVIRVAGHYRNKCGYLYPFGDVYATVPPTHTKIKLLFEGMYSPSFNQLIRKDSATCYLHQSVSPSSSGSSSKVIFDSTDNAKSELAKGSNNKISLNIELQKTAFKKYEPVIALFTYVNLNEKPDSVYNIFNKYLDDMKFRILDGNNNLYDKKVKLLDFTTACTYPEYIVGTNETLKVPLSLNSFGSPVQSEDNLYLDFSYFPEGKYRAYAYFENDCYKKFDPAIRSNEIEFEVISLNDQDDQVLKLFKEKKIDIIFNNFIENPFTEHIMKDNILDINSLKDNSKTIGAYEVFFTNYPKSIYNMDFSFIYNYLRNQQIGDINFEDLKNKLFILTSRYPSIISKEYLKTPFINSQVRYIVNQKTEQNNNLERNK